MSLAAYRRALVAVDLGALSCRVSLLRGNRNEPRSWCFIVSRTHRFRRRKGGVGMSRQYSTGL
jgi:hypothetical protein